MSLVSKKRQSLNDKFSKIIQKFNIKDFREYVLLVFQDLTWDIIVRAILKYNLTTKMQDIGKLLLEYTREFKIEELENIYSNILLIDLKLHPARKVWTTVCMKQEDQIPLDTDCALNITKEFRKHSKSANVYSDVSGDIRWFIIIVNKRTKTQGIIHQKPICIAHPLNSSFIFHAPAHLPEDTLKIIISGFGYDDHKIFKLSGRSIPSLMTMLKRHKDADKLRTKTAMRLKNATDLQCVRSSKGIDFCQDKLRVAHAREIFGGDLIQLETLTVNAETEWRGIQALPEAKEKSIDVTMRLRSKDIRKSLEKLIESGVIKPPYPNWLTEFLISGKNVIKIG